MKILQINAVYGIGSTGFYTRKLHEMLIDNGEESYVICRRISAECVNTKNVCTVSNDIFVKMNALYSRVSGIQGHSAFFSTRQIINCIEKISPEIIVLENIHDNFVNIKMLLEYIARKGIPLVVVLHDCWFFTGKCMHFNDIKCMKWVSGCHSCEKLKKDIPSFFFDKTMYMLKEKKDLFDKINKLVVVGVSQRITQDASKSYVFKGKSCVCIKNAIDDTIFYPRETHKKSKEKIIFGASSQWSTYKGVEDFLYINNFLRKNYDKEYKIKLAGGLKDISGKLLEEFERQGIEIVGELSPEEMAEHYSNADVFVSVSKGESFGCTLAESVMCGTPVVSYSGYAESEIVKDGKCGRCVECKNIEDLAVAVCNVLRAGKTSFKANLTDCSKEYSFKSYLTSYIEIFRKIL